MKGDLKRISAILGRLLQARGMGGHLAEYRLAGNWRTVAGAVIAQHSRPFAIRGKKLTLIVDSPAWMQQLSLLKPELIKKIGQAMGEEAVRDIVFRLGEVIADGAIPQQVQSIRPLDSADRSQIESIIRNIGDAETREAMRRVVEKDLLRKKART